MFIAALWTFVCFLLFFCDTAWLVFKGFLWSSGFVLFAVFVLFMFMLCAVILVLEVRLLNFYVCLKP